MKFVFWFAAFYCSQTYLFWRVFIQMDIDLSQILMAWEVVAFFTLPLFFLFILIISLILSNEINNNHELNNQNIKLKKEINELRYEIQESKLNDKYALNDMIIFELETAQNNPSSIHKQIDEFKKFNDQCHCNHDNYEDSPF